MELNTTTMEVQNKTKQTIRSLNKMLMNLKERVASTIQTPSITPRVLVRQGSPSFPVQHRSVVTGAHRVRGAISTTDRSLIANKTSGPRTNHYEFKQVFSASVSQAHN